MEVIIISHDLPEPMESEKELVQHRGNVLMCRVLFGVHSVFLSLIKFHKNQPAGVKWNRFSSVLPCSSPTERDRGQLKLQWREETGKKKSDREKWGYNEDRNREGKRRGKEEREAGR